MGRSRNLYAPSPSDIVTICGICSAGLVSVTVTPGKAAPVLSLIVPSMLPFLEVCAQTVLLSTTVWAQTSRNGSIDGTIKDNTGAALPGVTVTLTSPALQIPQMVTISEGDGAYKFLDLPIGTYRLSYDLAGFATLV